MSMNFEAGKLEAGDFRAIVAKDPERMLLRWMDDPGKSQSSDGKSGFEWANFCAVCRGTINSILKKME